MFIVSEEFLRHIQKSTIIIGGVKSAHKCIALKVQLNKDKRGPGPWKMNIAILDNKPFHKHIQQIIKETRNTYTNMPNQILCEICKIKIKEESFVYCKQNQMIKKKNVRARLEKQILEAEEQNIAAKYNDYKLIGKGII